MSSAKGTKLALIQLLSVDDKESNIKNAIKMIETAKNNSADIAILPECFNSPYGTKFFPKYAESIPDGATSQALSECARKNNIFVVGGTIPEKDGDKLFNTCTVWNSKGELVAKHRKIHLFDIDIPGKITFKESDALSPGNNYTIFETDKLKIGVGICYDVRFPELGNIYRNEGCNLLVYPGSFNDVTGPLHWALLLRARAVDNQVYVTGVAPARNENAEYKSYGHTMFVNPLGQVESETEYQEGILYGYVDTDKITETRQNIPILKQRRTDLYDVTYPRL